MNKLILIGAGGHSKVIQDIAADQNMEIYAIVSDDICQTKVVDGIIRANISLLTSWQKSELIKYKFCLAIGNNSVRRQLFTRLAIPLDRYAVLVHSSAEISKSARLGYGSVVMPKAVINAEATIGNHCIINTGAVIEHDNSLADYVHISPNATLCGTVSVGEGTHIGAGSVVIPGKNVGQWSLIGAGATVTHDIPSRVKAVGTPAKIIGKYNKTEV